MLFVILVLSVLSLTESNGLAANETLALIGNESLTSKNNNGANESLTVSRSLATNGSSVVNGNETLSLVKSYGVNESLAMVGNDTKLVVLSNDTIAELNPIGETNGTVTEPMLTQTTPTRPTSTEVTSAQPTTTHSAPTLVQSSVVDREATFMALEKASALLEPPKELFQQIHSDLAVIRSSFGNVSDVRYVSNWVPGKLLCNRIDVRAVHKVNASEFGPVKEDRSEHYTALTFAKPYNTPVLINKLKENGLLEDAFDCRVDGIIDGKSNIIYNYDKTYTFHKNLGDCALTCAAKHYWTFEVKNGTAILIKESKT